MSLDFLNLGCLRTAGLTQSRAFQLIRRAWDRTLHDLVGAGSGCQPEAVWAAAFSLEMGRRCAGRAWGSARSGGCTGWVAGDPVTRCRFGFGTHNPETAEYFMPSNFNLLTLVPVTPGTFVPRESSVVNVTTE